MANSSARRSSWSWFLACLLLALVALAAWFLRADRAASASAPTLQKSSIDAATAAGLQDASDTGETTQRASIATEVPGPVLSATPTPPQAAPTPEVPDLAARDWLALRIVDERHTPIFDAAVTICGLRKHGDEGSWYSRRDDASPVRSERDGRARVPFERWTDIDAKTVRVDLLVEHADFIPFNDSSFVLSPGEHVIELKQGSMLWLTAWHGVRDRVVPDVSITVEWEAQLGQDAWRREANGSWSTTRLGPGQHWITVTHTSTELGSLAGDFTPFEIDQYGRVDLELELKPLVALRGRLDDAVPRPIVDGHVWLNLHTGDGSLGLSSDHETTVAADGTFEIRGLRRASGQVVALCDGWVSKLVPPRSLEQSRTHAAPDASPAELADLLARVQDEDRIAQPVDASQAVPIVIEMELAGELEVHVTDDTGAGLESVLVSASPNVYWNGVGSTLFPWRSWAATTDARGLARIANLPVDPSLWFGAGSATHQLRKADRDHNPSVNIESGKTTRHELILEKVP